MLMSDFIHNIRIFIRVNSFYLLFDIIILEMSQIRIK